MNQPIIEMEDVYFSYEDQPVLQNINLTIAKGEFIGLVGPNGGGKTTLVRMILGLVKPSKGTVRILGKQIQSFKDWGKIGYVSQKSNSFNRGFPATVFEVVSMGLTAKIGYLRFFKEKHKQKVETALKQVDMYEFKDQNISNLSGGQQQRVFIARALVSDPEILILDEPTVGIDAKNVRRFYELLHRLNQNGITLLLITHDIGTMNDNVSRVICLNKTLHFHDELEKNKRLTNEQLSLLYRHPLQMITHEH